MIPLDNEHLSRGCYGETHCPSDDLCLLSDSREVAVFEMEKGLGDCIIPHSLVKPGFYKMGFKSPVPGRVYDGAGKKDVGP